MKNRALQPVLCACAAVLGSILLVMPVAAVEMFHETAKLTASDGAAHDFFGAGVAVDGDTAVIGAFRDDDRGSNSGSAYVFNRSGGVWTETAKLTASDGAQDDGFGSVLVVDDDTAIIGAPWDDNHAGSAYVFTRSGGVWAETAKLTASDRRWGYYFGSRIAVDGDTAVISGGNRSAYVFTRSGGVWTETAKLTPSYGAGNDGFGRSVAVDGDTAIIGAYNDDAGSGSAYLFTRSGGVWTETAKFTASDGASGDQFGSSVTVDGDTAIIGAYRDDDGDSDSGSAYVFAQSGGVWTETAKLTASTPSRSARFGLFIALDGDTAVIGANHEDGYSGAAYVFARSGGVWTETAKLTASDKAPGDFFGFKSAVYGETAVIGAHGDNDRGSDSGSAYVFTLAPVVSDSDGDGVNDDDDNCPDDSNPDQTDTDLDGAGDACDTDDDADGRPDDSDNCQFTANPDQIDLDGDGLGDACDADLDGDGTCDDPAVQTGCTGGPDNCPVNPNPFQTDTDTDGAGDDCDEDDDNDGVCDIDQTGAACVAGPDNCPTLGNPDQADSPDGDGIGDICDADDDNDGANDDVDNCPVTANADQNDTDSDGAGDACDDDDDGDGVLDTADNCQFVSNADQGDTDGDGTGDACNDANDADGDEWSDSLDNCPTVANSGQHDLDGDGIGDACDTDIDGDGTDNDSDQCAATPPGGLVNPSNGCTIAQLCPCDGPRGTTSSWKNHGKYVSSVARAANDFMAEGLIDESERGEIVSEAAQSACGHRN